MDIKSLIATEPEAPKVFKLRYGPSAFIATSPLKTVNGIPKNSPLPDSDVIGLLSSEESYLAKVRGTDRPNAPEEALGSSPLIERLKY
jgi:hypothetical protein